MNEWRMSRCNIERLSLHKKLKSIEEFYLKMQICITNLARKQFNLSFHKFYFKKILLVEERAKQTSQPSGE